MVLAQHALFRYWKETKACKAGDDCTWTVRIDVIRCGVHDLAQADSLDSGGLLRFSRDRVVDVLVCSKDRRL